MPTTTHAADLRSNPNFQPAAFFCRSCGARSGAPCLTKTGNVATQPHAVRIQRADAEVEVQVSLKETREEIEGRERRAIEAREHLGAEVPSQEQAGTMADDVTNAIAQGDMTSPATVEDIARASGHPHHLGAGQAVAALLSMRGAWTRTTRRGNRTLYHFGVAPRPPRRLLASGIIQRSQRLIAEADQVIRDGQALRARVDATTAAQDAEWDRLFDERTDRLMGR